MKIMSASHGRSQVVNGLFFSGLDLVLVKRTSGGLRHVAPSEFEWRFWRGSSSLSGRIFPTEIAFS
jgi:hypothetical protein